MIAARPLCALLPLLLTTSALAAPGAAGSDPSATAQQTAASSAPAQPASTTGQSSTAPSTQAPSHQAQPTPPHDTGTPPQSMGDGASDAAQPDAGQNQPAPPPSATPIQEKTVSAAPTPASDATPPLSTACLQIATDSAQGGAGSYDATQYVASVPNTNVKLTIARLTIDDQSHRLSASDARGLAALSVLGALSAAMGRAPDGCQDATMNSLTHTLSSDVADGASPRIVWRGVALQHGTHVLTATDVDASLAPDAGAGMLRLNASGHGIAETSTDHIVPNQMMVDVSAPASALTNFTGGAGSTPLTIHGLHAIIGTPSGDVALDANGRATIAADPHDTNADGRVTVTNLTALIDLARRSGQSMVTTAMSVGQLVGHRSGDQTSWDIKYADSLILINNIPLPLSVR